MMESMSIQPLRRMPTGVRGFDEISQEGLVEGRTPLIVGTSGSGKTLFALELLFRMGRVAIAGRVQQPADPARASR